MAKDKNVTGEEILDVCSAYMSADDLKLVEKAWHYATDAHSEQFRQSGEPYIIHPIQVAGILADLHLDAVTVACVSHECFVEDTERR
ncbi:GTP diphosphokinase [Streptococcus thermophilus CNCM I-1630]|nr:GTP diphosphokinase [Streptococcus thermophilus CNCM I-1630]